jgi:hypothetical protein
MNWHSAANLTVILLGSILVACGGPAPKGESEQTPAAETSVSSESESDIFEEGFEAGDDKEWSESVVAPDGEDEDSEPDVP